MANSTTKREYPLDTLGTVEFKQSFVAAMEAIDDADGNVNIEVANAGRALTADDAGKYLRVTSASANNLTVNDEVFKPGDRITVRQCDAGASTFVAGSGVTFNKLSAKTLVTGGNGAVVNLVCVTPTNFDLFGDLA